MELVSQMQWPFAMVCIAFFGLCAAIYVTRRTTKAIETEDKVRQLTSEVYRLTHTKSGE